MRKLKEEVKAGTMTATDALVELKKAATLSGDVPYVYGTKTWRWLQRRKQEQQA